MKRYPFPPALSAFVLLSFSGVASAQNPWDTAKRDKFEQVIFNGSGSSRWQQFRASLAGNRPLTEQDVVYNDAVFRLKWSSAESDAWRLKRTLSDEAGVRIITFDDASNTVWIQANKEHVRRAKEILKRLDEKKRVDNCFLLIGLEHVSSVQASRLTNLIIMLVNIVDEDFYAHVAPWHSREPMSEDDKRLLIYGTVEMKQTIKELVQWLDAMGKKVNNNP